MLNTKLHRKERDKGIPVSAGLRTGYLLVALVIFAFSLTPDLVRAGPTVEDRNLEVREVVSGLTTPISMAFLGDNDILVLEKNTGRVKRVKGGRVGRALDLAASLSGRDLPEIDLPLNLAKPQVSTVLDLAVNFASERGLLGIALHPDFSTNGFVYLYWTESTTGADTDVLSATPLLGNRVDRFVWDGSSLSFDQNLIQLRAIQDDATNGRERGNHDGGVLRFGPDGKLYIFIGDVGRRGQMQNLPNGPFDANEPTFGTDDQFGGPEPDDAHLTGVILRLNDDGTTPEDNPFFEVGAAINGEVGANIQKVFSYGHRNAFGMAFDPISGDVWLAENGDDSFTELNRVEPGMNGGWVQIMGPVERIGQFKAIETSEEFFGLQQVRWSPENIADTPEEALARLFTLFEPTNEFVASLDGNQEVPPVDTSATGSARFQFNDDGTLGFELRADTAIQDVTQAHIHLGARGQNGPIVAFLFGFIEGGEDFAAGQLIASGTLDDDNIIARTGFVPSVANLVQRMQQQRTYANVHTLAHPPGEMRGQIIPDSEAVSRYSDPEFSWKFEVAPAGIGFLNSRALGPQYEGDLFTGAARTSLEGGQIFHFNLTGNRRKIGVDDPRLEDRVADNLDKFDITESETLLFGRGFGVGTDIQTGPNGNLFVVSLDQGAIYEIFRTKPIPTKPVRRMNR